MEWVCIVGASFSPSAVLTPCLGRKLAVSVLLLSIPTSSGVSPSSSLAFTLAPFVISGSTISLLKLLLDSHNGISPISVFELTFDPF